MKNKLFLLSLLGFSFILLGSRCSPSAVTPGQTVPESTEEPATASSGGEDMTGAEFVTFTNRAQGYTILRPDNWYWRHYIDNEIDNTAALDYFITDQNPLPGLGNDYLGKIVIEVSTKSLSDYQAVVAGFKSQPATVGGQSSTRYEGQKDNKTVIDYQFSKDNKTYRLILISAEAADVATFENVVSSFKFD